MLLTFRSPRPLLCRSAIGAQFRLWFSVLFFGKIHYHSGFRRKSDCVADDYAVLFLDSLARRTGIRAEVYVIFTRAFYRANDQSVKLCRTGFSPFPGLQGIRFIFCNRLVSCLVDCGYVISCAADRL